MAVDWAKWINAAAPIATTVASIAANRGKGREVDANQNQQQDVTTSRGYEVDKRTDLDALRAADMARIERALGELKEREFALAAPQARAGNAVRGDILAGLQDVSVSHPRANVVHASGGLRPSLLSADTRALGTQMSREALMDALGKPTTPFKNMPAADFSSITSRKAPDPTPLPQPSGLDRAMENIGTYGSLAAVVNEALRKQQQTPTTASQLATKALPTGTVAGTFQAPTSRNPYLG